MDGEKPCSETVPLGRPQFWEYLIEASERPPTLTRIPVIGRTAVPFSGHRLISLFSANDGNVTLRVRLRENIPPAEKAFRISTVLRCRDRDQATEMSVSPVSSRLNYTIASSELPE